MAKFDKAEYIADKSTEYFNSLVDILKGLGSNDPITAAKGATNAFITSLEIALDSNILTKDEADAKFKKIQLKGIGVFVDGKFAIIDVLNASCQFKKSPIDLTGSSIDDGNDKLYHSIDDHYLKFLFKRVFGNVIDLVISIIPQTRLLTLLNIADSTTKNHIINVDYKDKKSNTTQERKYILYKANPIFDKALGSVWGKISSDMQIYDRVIFTRDETPVEFIYQKQYYQNNNIKNVFEFRQGRDEYKIISVLKRINYPTDKKEAHLSFGKDDNPKKLITNYYANYGEGASRVLSDLKYNENDKRYIAIKHSAQHCLRELVGYTLKSDNPKISEYEDLKKYSDKHMQIN